ncbi:MAG: hypothetical protein KatS3mg073_1575 [Meiothermus sp.]|nr:MAG: hypothetical protein KatS3mg073_1575 [Meiothermus sp.]
MRTLLNKLRPLLTFCAFSFILFTKAQLSITNSTNAQALANALAGPGVTVVAGSATLNRANTGQNNTGTFTGGETGGPGPVIGIPNGVVLTSGNFSTSVLGPNNRKNSSVSGNQLTDPDLTALAGSTARYDTVILQFQVIPSGRTLNFQFVFGSEEYPEYVCSNFNDALGLFVSGPGISGPYSNSAINLAVLPNNSRISINTVNGGAVGYQVSSPVAGCDLGNAAYYQDNGDPNNSSSPNPSLFTNTQMDGFTRPLRNRVVVVPGQTYRIKIVIADAGDGAYDSTVLLGLISSRSDWGDAPDTYGTTAGNNGANHDLDTRIYIGSAPDADSNGQPGTAANGDDNNGINDENTFATFPVLTSSSTSYTLSNIPVTNTTGLPAVLAGWIDFNRNGLFDASERATVNVPSGATSATLQWTGLSSLSVGTTYLRLRLSSDLDFISNPTPTGGFDSGEVEDYAISIVFGAIVSGMVYHDLQPNNLNDAENWASGTAVYVNLVQGSTVVRSALVNAGSGAFSFNAIPAGSYQLIVTNSATATTPSNPPNWLFINPNPGQRSLTIISNNLTNQDFGLFNGSRIRGTVFRDDGLGGGTANDALQNGGEPGIPNVLVSASDGTNVRSATTDASGLYMLFIPASFGSSLTLSHPLQPATGSNVNGAGVSLASGYGSAAAASRTIGGFAPGQYYEGYNFGVVRDSRLSPDQSGQSPSPGTITYSHLYRPGTLGTVNLVQSGSSYTYALRRDVNCDGDFADAGEGFQPLPQSFMVDASWPRESDGSLRACALELQVVVPAGLPAGRVDIAQLQAALGWANNPTITDTRQVFDTTTVVTAGGLQLLKEVRNVSTGSAFAANVQGRPGEVLEYRITYQNIGSQPIFNVVLADPIPFFTTLVQNAYGGTGELELACPNGTLARPDLGSVGSISLNLASLCSLSTAPNPSGSGTLPALLPGQGGYLVYRVQIQ